MHPRGAVLYLTTIMRGRRWDDLAFAKAEIHIHRQIRRESGGVILRYAHVLTDSRKRIAESLERPLATNELPCRAASLFR